jgi:hypothetical protein
VRLHSVVGMIALVGLGAFSQCSTLAAQASTNTDTIVVTRGRPASARSSSFRVELLSVKDSRCPLEVQCVWAGHAVVLLRVTRRGGASDTVSIGTSAPNSMKLPFDATVFRRRLHLVQLTPAPSVERKVPLAQYRVSIEIGPG